MKKENLLVCECEEKTTAFGANCKCYLLDEEGEIKEEIEYREVKIKKED
jgi:hypothetical protein